MDISPTEKNIAVADMREITIYDITNGESLYKYNYQSNLLLYTPDGSGILLGKDKLAFLWKFTDKNKSTMFLDIPFKTDDENESIVSAGFISS